MNNSKSKEEKNMDIIKKMVAVASVLAFFLIGTTAFANEITKSYELRDLLWTRVQNLHGNYIGIVSNFVVDSQGHVSLAIIDRSSGKANRPEELVAVPFDALKWNSKGDYFVLHINRQVLAEAPVFHKSNDVSNPAFTTEMYKFFGLRPYWTDKAPSPYSWGGEAQNF
jgi:sporulation protein YlmC with PRC-barrel domain